VASPCPSRWNRDRIELEVLRRFILPSLPILPILPFLPILPEEVETAETRRIGRKSGKGWKGSPSRTGDLMLRVPRTHGRGDVPSERVDLEPLAPRGMSRRDRALARRLMAPSGGRAESSASSGANTRAGSNLPSALRRWGHLRNAFCGAPPESCRTSTQDSDPTASGKPRFCTRATATGLLARGASIGGRESRHRPRPPPPPPPILP